MKWEDVIIFGVLKGFKDSYSLSPAETMNLVEKIIVELYTLDKRVFKKIYVKHKNKARK